MEMNVIDKSFSNSVAEYKRAVNEIRICVAAYERISRDQIEKISKCSSLDDADIYFDLLQDIQDKMALLLFSLDFDVGSNMKILTKEFDRLYDPYIRNYWFEKFKSGAIWPE